MHHPLRTISLAMFSLLVALFMLSHDVLMAADPHGAGHHHASSTHMMASHPGADVAPADAATRCGTFAAVRDDLLLGGHGPSALPDGALVAPEPTCLASALAGPIEPGASPSRLRAQLQVWRE